MLSDITLGQYFPGFSILHKLDPRTKIISSIIYIVAIFVIKNVIGYALLILSALTLVFISKISLKVIIKGIKPVIIVLIFTMILNLFWTVGEGEPLVQWWIIKIYIDGIYRAIFMSLRVLVLIVATSLFLTYTTSPRMLTDAIESLLSPLKKIHVPIHDFAMMMTIALRFIPTLIEETDKIMNAQKSRGADFATGGLIKRAKALIPVLIPLLVSSFKRADELAIAMECRCYRGGKGRTKFVKLTMKLSDYVFMSLIILFLAAVIAINYLPFGLRVGV